MATNRSGTYVPSWQLVNTDQRMLDVACGILDSIDVAYKKAEGKPLKLNHAIPGYIMVAKLAPLARLLEHLIPLMICKQDRALLVREFCLLRIEATKSGRGQNAKPYGDKERLLFQQIKLMQTSYKVYHAA